MDKQTLSGYGWIVIVTLVLAVLLALATPFGTYVGDGVVTTVNGLINTSSKAVDEDQIDTMSDKWENKFSTFDKAGSVNNEKEETLAPGLYKTDGTFVSWEQLTSMEYQTITYEIEDYYDEEINVMFYKETTGAILNIDENQKLYSCADDHGDNQSSQYLEGKLIIDDGIEEISKLSDCENLTSIIIPESVTTIGDFAFSGCSSLTSITIPDSITSIGRDAFSYCTNLTNINIPKSVTSIGASTFYKCTNLTSIIIPKGVTSIGFMTFYDCTSLTSITIPDSITSIDREAFRGCSSLTSIIIPNSVTSIGVYTFYKCTSLTSINYSGTQTEWNSVTKNNYWNEGCPQITVHCTDGDIVIPAN